MVRLIGVVGIMLVIVGVAALCDRFGLGSERGWLGSAAGVVLIALSAGVFYLVFERYRGHRKHG